VLKRLAMEGRIHSVPRKGSFIVDAPRHLNIGIAMGDAADFTFIKSPDVLKGVISVTEPRGCYLRILQIAKVERARKIFEDYKLDACLWYLPDPPYFAKIAELAASIEIPLLPVIQSWASVPESELPPWHVASDTRGVGRRRVEFLFERGHRKIGRLNTTVFPSHGNEGEEYEEFAATLGRLAGQAYKPGWSVGNDQIETGVPRVLEEGEITAATVNGGENQLLRTLKALSGHPLGSKLELLVDYVGSNTFDIIARHPELRISGVNMHPTCELGRRAAETLLAVLDGAPEASCKVPAEIRRPDGSPFTSKETQTCCANPA
jgi:DNA-binding LacI/PurR family transcriptional regulator